MFNAFIEIDGKRMTGNEIEQYSIGVDIKLHKPIPFDQRLLFENPK